MTAFSKLRKEEGEKRKLGQMAILSALSLKSTIYAGHDWRALQRKKGKPTRKEAVFVRGVMPYGGANSAGSINVYKHYNCPQLLTSWLIAFN